MYNRQQLANIGEIGNQGVEINLGLHVIRTKDWLATVRAAINTNRNRVLSDGGTVPFSIGAVSYTHLKAR